MLLGTAAFALNPVLLLESAGNGHNDILVAMFMLLAVWLGLSRGTRGLANWGQWLVLPALALAAMVKGHPGIGTAPSSFSTCCAAAIAGVNDWHCWPSTWVWPPPSPPAQCCPFGRGWQNWAVRNLGSGAGRSPFCTPRPAAATLVGNQRRLRRDPICRDGCLLTHLHLADGHRDSFRGRRAAGVAVSIRCCYVLVCRAPQPTVPRLVSDLAFRLCRPIGPTSFVRPAGFVGIDVVAGHSSLRNSPHLVVGYLDPLPWSTLSPSRLSLVFPSCSGSALMQTNGHSDPQPSQFLPAVSNR